MVREKETGEKGSDLGEGGGTAAPPPPREKTSRLSKGREKSERFLERKC